MASKKKLLTSAVALGTAAVLALGGTFAWQSINQTALNESSDDVNPGGRLHDDFDGENKDVYVENFAEEPIFARIRLSEYFEVVMNYGGEAETRDVVIGDYDDESGTRTGEVFKFDDRIDEALKTVNAGMDDISKVDSESDSTAPYYWWTWTMGGTASATAYYMPTFNMNKDSLVADINGQYKEPGVITSQDYKQYTGYVKYGEETKDGIMTMPGTEIFDADRNTVDEVGSDFSDANLTEKQEAGNIVLYNHLDGGTTPAYMTGGSGIKHTAKPIGITKGLISMADWLDLNGGTYSAETHGGYWVYDTDGWVYWSSPIAPSTTTGRLLDKIEMNHVMDDSWYYKITVEAQFVTADDVGKANSTGFYQDVDTTPSDNAETLLGLIGVRIPNAAAAPGGGDEDLSTLTSLQLGTTTPVSLSANEQVRLLTDGGQYPNNVTLTANGTTLAVGTDYTYSNSTGVLTLLTSTSCAITVTGVETQTGTIYANGYTPPSSSTAQTYELTLKTDGELPDGESAPSQVAAIGDTVNITLSGVTNPLSGYSMTSSAVGLFTIGNTTSALASWTRTTEGDNTEVYSVLNYGTLKLNYETGTIQFLPQQAATIAVTIGETVYNGSITMSGSLPSTGG